jgi:hypothetical protein
MNSNRKWVLANGAPVSDLRYGPSNQPLISDGGEINASSKKDLVGQVTRVMAAARSGQLRRNPETVQKRQQVLAAAYSDATAYRNMGTALAAEIQQALGRVGFARNLMVEETLAQGAVPRHRTRIKNVTAVVIDGAGQAIPQVVRDNYLYPAEVSISTNIVIEKREQNQATGDIVEEKYNDGLEAIGVAEDQMFLQLANMATTVGSAVNLPTTFAGAFTPATLVGVSNQVSRWRLPATTALISQDFWQDIAQNAAWMAVFDPVSQYEVLMTGRIGQLFGLQLITDGFRLPEQQVMPEGTFYVLTASDYLGAFTNRGGIEATPLNLAQMGQAGVGWFLSEEWSISLTNNRGVARGIRS